VAHAPVRRAEQRGPRASSSRPGLFETGANSRTSISILSSSRHFRDVLQAKGYRSTTARSRAATTR
jgi:hypothetical protein